MNKCIASHQKLLSELFKVYLQGNNSSFIIIDIAIVGGRKYGHDCGKILRMAPFVKAVSLVLNLMSSDDREDIIIFNKLVSKLEPKKIWASSEIILLDQGAQLTIIFLDGVRPHQIAQDSWFGDFSYSVNFVNLGYLND